MRTLAIFALLAPASLSQTIVLPGDDLAAIVASAPDGDVIEIRSNETFVGGLTWAGKFLTLTAGAGFTPTIRGDVGQVALGLSPTNPGTDARCVGLRIIGGPTDGSTPISVVRAIGLGGTGTGTRVSVELEDCFVGGAISTGGTGSALGTLRLIDTDVVGRLSGGGTGDWQGSIEVTSGSYVEFVALVSTGSARTELMASDSAFGGPIDVNSVSSSEAELELRRCTIGGPLTFDAGSMGSTDVLLETCHLRGDGAGTGLESLGTASVRGVNLTVTGFEIGLDTGAGASFENLLMDGNVSDIAPSVPVGTIFNSLISDGTFAGVDGNFAGSPVLGPDSALGAGSIGLDAGNSGATDLGPFDLGGSPRVQDSNLDGLAVINVGAYESLTECRAARHEYFNGSGSNSPDYWVQEDAVLGSSFVGGVLTEASTVTTLLAIGQRSASPVVLSGFDGELLLDIAAPIKINVSAGSHTLGVPSDPALCGLVVETQALRVSFSGVIPTAEALNGASLVLGV